MSKKGQRHKNLTATYLSGKLDEDRLRGQQRFTQRNKNHQQEKTARTTLLRAAEADQIRDIEALPTGRVIQVHSVYIDVQHAGAVHLCVVRKTMAKTSDTRVIVGDQVRFSSVSPGEGVIEQVEPRRSILTRADVRAGREGSVGQIPIVANADQMLIVVSLHLPRPKWGLVDRMIIAARSGGLAPIVCLNKIDVIASKDDRISPNQAAQARVEAEEVLCHYEKSGIVTLQTSASTGQGISALAECLRNQTTVLAGHSGVGKSSLIQAVQPGLSIRVGEISNFNQKGRHTTSSARLYDLSVLKGTVIDTPGVKLFGLVNVTKETLIEHFPDVADNTAPPWRVDSFKRIAQSLGGELAIGQDVRMIPGSSKRGRGDVSGEK